MIKKEFLKKKKEIKEQKNYEVKLKNYEIKSLKRCNKKLIKKEKIKQNQIKKHSKKMLRLNEGNIYLLSIVLVFAGVLIYCISYCLSRSFCFYNEYIKGVIDDVAKILITISLGSCLLEWFGFVEYIRKRIRDVITEDDYIHTLTNERKKELKSKIERDVFYPDGRPGENSLLSVVQDEIYPLLSKYYYKEYVTHLVCEIKQDKIIKTIKRHIVISKDINESLSIPVSTFFNPLVQAQNLEDAKKCASLNSIKVTKGDEIPQDITDKYTLMWEKHESEDLYQYSYCLSGDDLRLEGDQLVVDIDVTTTVNFKDYVYIQRVDCPCKDFTINFHYNENHCEIDGNAFGFMTKAHNNKVTHSNVKNCYIIRFNDWLLPGDGVCFYINIK